MLKRTIYLYGSEPDVIRLSRHIQTVASVYNCTVDVEGSSSSKKHNEPLDFA